MSTQHNSIFSILPVFWGAHFLYISTYRAQKQKQNPEMLSIEINIAHRGYFKQTGHVLDRADKRRNWQIWVVMTRVFLWLESDWDEKDCAKQAERQLEVKKERELPGWAQEQKGRVRSRKNNKLIAGFQPMKLRTSCDI